MNKNSSKQKNNKPNNKNKWRAIFWIAIIFLVFSLLNTQSFNISGVLKELKYSEFYNLVKNNLQTKSIK